MFDKRCANLEMRYIMRFYERFVLELVLVVVYKTLWCIKSYLQSSA